MGFRPAKKEEYDRIWELIKPVVNEHGGYVKEDIIYQLNNGDMQGHVWADKEVKAAFVTQIIDYPRQRVYLLLFGGGTGLKKWKDTARAYFEVYALANGCHEMQILGRLGWGKMYPDARTTWAIYRSEI